MLVDSAIRKHKDQGFIIISPWNDNRLGSNSYDLTLSSNLLVYTEKTLDAKKNNPSKIVKMEDTGFMLLPGELYLGSTVEYTKTHKTLVPQLEGKSSIARLGIQVHMTAGFGDAGFDGHWTLEITCVKPVTIYPDMPIAQIFYFQTLGDCINPYNRKVSAKYAGQGNLPVASSMWRNFI